MVAVPRAVVAVDLSAVRGGRVSSWAAFREDRKVNNGSALSVFVCFSHRLSHWARCEVCHPSGRALLGPFERLIRLMAVAVSGCMIAPECRIGPGLRIPHAQGIVIAVQGHIGRDVGIMHQVTLGQRDADDNDDGLPLFVGDGALVGAGAKVLGPVSIGARAKIGANAVVLQDVPAGATAVGIPARIVPHR